MNRCGLILFKFFLTLLIVSSKVIVVQCVLIKSEESHQTIKTTTKINVNRNQLIESVDLIIGPNSVTAANNSITSITQLHQLSRPSSKESARTSEPPTHNNQARQQAENNVLSLNELKIINRQIVQNISGSQNELDWNDLIRQKRNDYDDDDDDNNNNDNDYDDSTMMMINASQYYTNDSDEFAASNYTFTEEDYLEDIRKYIFPKAWTWILIIFHTVVFVIGVVGNILVCVAVYRNHTMRTVTNYFIVNLAVADFLVILFCLPPSVVWDVTLTWFFGIAMCKIVLYLQSVSVTVSVLTLTFISIDRWYAICFPLKFKSTTGRAKTAIGIIWIVALACDIPEMVYSTTKQRQLPVETIYFTQCAPSWSIETDTIFMIIKMILFYLVPLLFMSITYLQIIRVLWRSGNMAHQIVDVTGTRQVNTFAMNMNASTEGQLRSRRKAAKMLVAVVVMFAFCYFPVHLLSVLRLTIGMKNSDSNQAFSLISHWLCYANSAVNPIIYNFMSGKFRKEFRRAFEHPCCQSSAAASTATRRFHFNTVYYHKADGQTNQLDGGGVQKMPTNQFNGVRDDSRRRSTIRTTVLDIV